jgi:heat shock protein HtpX
MGLGKLRAAMFFTFVILFGTLLALSGVIVWLVAPDMYASSAITLIAFLVGLAVAFTLIQFALAPFIIRAFTNMHELDPKEFKWIYEMADDIAKKAGIKRKPKLYIVNDGTPNAFAFGWGKNHAFIALHTGLLELLNKDEIKSVLAHEMGHVKHRDMVVITIASMIPVIVYYLIVAAGSIIARRDDENNGLATIFVFIGAYIAQFFTYLIVLYLSRTREFYADAFGAAATNPRDMRTALAKIAYGFPAISNKRKKKYEKTRAFYIADPIAASDEQEKRDRELSKDLDRSGKKREAEGTHIDSAKHLEEAMQWEREAGAAHILNIFSTHPLTYKRIDNLHEFEKQPKMDPKDV